MSAVEAVADVAAGCGIAVIATAVVLPAFDHDVTGGDALGIGAIFTLVSPARSCALRRPFESLP